MIKFDLAQENFIQGKYPVTLAGLLRGRKLEQGDKSSNEYLYVFQEVARAATRMYLSCNRYFETLMIPEEVPSSYHLERVKNLNKALSDALTYFENYRLTPKVVKALRYLEEDEETGETVLDVMPRGVPLSLAVVDPETSETELVTLILDPDTDEATIINEEGEEFTVDPSDIEQISMMDEVPDALKGVDSMGAVSSQSLSPSEMYEGGEDAGAEGEGMGEMGGAGEMGNMSGMEDMGDMGDMGDMSNTADMEDMGDTGAEMSETETEDTSPSENETEMESFQSGKTGKKRFQEKHQPVDIAEFTKRFEQTLFPQYYQEEDVPLSMLKTGKLDFGKSILSSPTKPEKAKIGNPEDLKETTFKGGFQTDPPEESKDIRRSSSDDTHARSLYKKGANPVKSAMAFENRFKPLKNKTSNYRVKKYK